MKEHQQNLTKLQRDLALAIFEGVEYKVRGGVVFTRKPGRIVWNTPNYENSLDALLPVIERIEDEWVGRGVMSVEIIGVYCKVAFQDEGESIDAEYTVKDVKTKIEAVYKAVSDYCHLQTKDGTFVYISTDEGLKGEGVK